MERSPVTERSSPLVELGDDSTYKIEGVGSTSLQLDSGTVLHIDDIVYAFGLKKNLLSLASLEDKGYKFLFMEKKVILWEKDTYVSSVVQIGVREGGLYKDFDLDGDRCPPTYSTNSKQLSIVAVS